MLLIIPSVHIRGGVCFPDIATLSEHGVSTYREPNERARLLRTENAKALHLFFDDEPAFSDASLKIIQKIRTAVDIPIEVTALKTTAEDIKKLFAAGVYRVCAREPLEKEALKPLMDNCGARQLAFYVPQQDKLPSLEKLNSVGVCRLVVDWSPESHETTTKIVEVIQGSQIRLSVIARSLSYKTLVALTELKPNLDSVVLDSVLESDSFPCEQLWRLSEERAATHISAEANLWKNPLQKTAGF